MTDTYSAAATPAFDLRDRLGHALCTACLAQPLGFHQAFHVHTPEASQ